MGQTKRPFRWAVRAAIVGLLGAAAVVVAVSACLPDLTALAPITEVVVAPAPLCGDSLIETLDDGGDAGESCDPGEAGAPGCDRCQVVCNGGSRDDAGGHCYFVGAPSTSYLSAAALCRDQGGHLVTVASEREGDFATALAGDLPYWIGLDVRAGVYVSRGVSEPGFPRNGGACAGCFGLGADAGVFDVHTSAKSGQSDLSCLVSDQKRWFQVPCDKGLPFQTLCEREAVGRRAQYCSGPFCTTLPATVGSKRYVIVLEPVTADAAHEACKSYDDGAGSLVTFATSEEREQLARELALLVPGPTTFWIGLSGDGGTWTWEDDGGVVGQTSRPNPWGDGQPAGPGRAFLSLDDEYKFDTRLVASADKVSGPALRPFVCQRR